MPLNRRQALTAGAALGAMALLPRASRAAATASAVSPALSAEERALHALNRFAYGPTPADMAALQQQGAKPWLDAWLAQQLEPRRISLPAPLADKLASLEVLKKSPAELLALYREAHKEVREAKKGAAQSNTDAANAVREQIKPLVAQAASARVSRALQSPAQLQEVLTEFWFNHFNVFVGKGPVSVLVADYEEHAIRPHVLGRFRDMLGATAKHPAMLIYLDNVLSVVNGYEPPHRRRLMLSDKVKAKAATGLNENYAREVMELHTLGVDGGYTQRDVTELARMLTGWTVNPREAWRGHARDLFEFDAKKHDPGTKTWLGQTFGNGGQSEGERALDLLAAHPSTARHIATKFAQAFVADEPPASLVSRLADNFKATGGDLRALTQTLLAADEFWSREAYGAKFKTPYQYLMSSLRAVDVTTPPLHQVLQGLAQAGQPLYGSVTPDGYKNTAAAWRNPEALTQRVQLASTLAQRARPEPLLATLGPLFSETTRKTVAAEPPGQQVALLLASPDFMRR